MSNTYRHESSERPRKVIVDHYAESRADVLECEGAPSCREPALILTFGHATIVLCNAHALALGFRPRVMPSDIPARESRGAYVFRPAALTP